jgi:hypothetical protein
MDPVTELKNAEAVLEKLDALLRETLEKMDRQLQADQGRVSADLVEQLKAQRDLVEVKMRRDIREAKTRLAELQARGRAINDLRALRDEALTAWLHAGGESGEFPEIWISLRREILIQRTLEALGLYKLLPDRGRDLPSKKRRRL